MSWMAQFETAVLQSFWLENGGRGFEHHFPHLYSQVGAGGGRVMVDVHKADVVLGVVITLVVVVVHLVVDAVQ